MQFPVLSERTTLLALGYRPALFLDFEERTVGVVARARAVAFDARLAVPQQISVPPSSRGVLKAGGPLRSKPRRLDRVGNWIQRTRRI